MVLGHGDLDVGDVEELIPCGFVARVELSCCFPSSAAAPLLCVWFVLLVTVLSDALF